jgi:hypothetical protein
MIRDNIQGKSFKKNYGYLLRCSIEEFFFLVSIPTVQNSRQKPTYRKELLQIIQNRIKVLT